MKLLIIEDDETISGFIVRGFQEAGFTVDAVTTAEAGLDLLRTGSYDAAVVDLMLPGMDGLAFIDTLRDERNPLPILILSARRSLDDRIGGIQRGADDYLVKPFSFSELLVRVQALLRRRGSAEPETKLRAADLELDLVKRDVRRGDQAIDLQPKEFALLEYFLRNRETVLSKTMIMERIWDYSFDPQTNVVDVLVSRLRSKVDKNYDRKLIHTVRGVGYVLRER